MTIESSVAGGYIADIASMMFFTADLSSLFQQRGFPLETTSGAAGGVRVSPDGAANAGFNRTTGARLV